MQMRIACWAWLTLALYVGCGDQEADAPALDAALLPANPSAGGGVPDAGSTAQPGMPGGTAGTTAGGAMGAGATAAGGNLSGQGSPGGPGATTAGGAAAGTGATGGATGGATSGGGGTTGAGATTGGGASMGGGTTPTPLGPNCLKGTGDFNAKGPYKVKRTNVTIGSQGPYTIFAPDPLEAACPHPIVAWGNGTGVSDADTYAFYQEHAASWGLVVVAALNSNVGSGAFHKAGLDYMLEQNKTQGSPFFGKLSTHAGTSGHSQGGMGANAGASHPNVEVIVNVQGAFGAAPRGKNFLCLTGTKDINPAGCKSAVDGATAPAFLANWEGGDHTGTATLLGFVSNDPGTKQYMRLYSAWFRCFLANDQAACAMFKGGMGCPLCKDTGWAEIYAKNY